MKDFKITRENLNAYTVRLACETFMNCPLKSFPLPFEIKLANKLKNFKADKWYQVWKFETDEETPRLGYFNIITAEIITPAETDIKDSHPIKERFYYKEKPYAIRRKKGFLTFAESNEKDKPEKVEKKKTKKPDNFKDLLKARKTPKK